MNVGSHVTTSSNKPMQSPQCQRSKLRSSPEGITMPFSVYEIQEHAICHINRSNGKKHFWLSSHHNHSYPSFLLAGQHQAIKLKNQHGTDSTFCLIVPPIDQMYST